MKLTTITLSGADDAVPTQELGALQQAHPLAEFGILCSAKRRGQPRYPKIPWIMAASLQAVRLSAHLCGEQARDACLGQIPPFLGYFERLQLNIGGTEALPVDWPRFRLEMAAAGKPVIFQVALPRSWSLDLMRRSRLGGIAAVALLDRSGGRGILDGDWPGPPSAPCGYAGGLTPDNVAAQLDRIAAVAGDAKVWIDAESGLRDERDRFDLRKAERFLAAAETWREKNGAK